MKINQLKAGVILSYGTQTVHILTGLLYTPIMLRLLGQSEYGLYQLVYSVVSYLSLLSLGFSSSYVRFYSRYKSQNDTQGVAKLNGMFISIFSIISLICILCGVVMVSSAQFIFGTGLTPAELSKARILLAIMVLNMAATFIDSVFSSIITAHEKFFFQKLVFFLKELFNPFLALPLLIMGYGSVAMVTVTTVLTTTVLVLNIFFCLKKLKVKFVFKDLQFSLFKEMWIFTFFIFINMIVDQVNWNIGKFLLGRLVGTTAVAVFGVASQLNSLYLTLSTAVSAVFIPRVNFIVSAGGNAESALSSLLSKVGRIQYLILGLIITGFVLFGREFIALWAGQGYEDSYTIGLLLMVPATVPLIQNLGMQIQRAMNMHKARSIIYLFMAIGNVLISIPCIKHFGAVGAAVGTSLSLIICNGLIMNWYYQKKMRLDIVGFWKEIFELILPTLGVVLIGIIAVKLVPINGNLVLLGGHIVLYSLFYAAAMWKFGMNRREKQLVLVPLKKVGGKLCKHS